jgi:hypothetical protein
MRRICRSGNWWDGDPFHQAPPVLGRGARPSLSARGPHSQVGGPDSQWQQRKALGALRPTGRGASHRTRHARGITRYVRGIRDVSPKGNGDIGQGGGGVGHGGHRRKLPGPIVHPEHVGE